MLMLLVALWADVSRAGERPVRLPKPKLRVASMDEPIELPAARVPQPKIIGFTPESPNTPQTMEPIDRPAASDPDPVMGIADLTIAYESGSGLLSWNGRR